MNILYHHRTEGDGAEGIHVREMIHAFREKGHDVSLVSITDRGDVSQQVNKRKPFVIKNQIPPLFYELAEITYNLIGLALLSRSILQKRPDFIYERYSLYNLTAGIAGHLFGIPSVLEVNAPLAYERSSEPDEKIVFRELGNRFEREAFSRATGIVVVSTPLKKHIVSLGIDPSKILVLPNGVDKIRFAPKEKDPFLMKRYGIADGSVVLGFTGIFRHWHGIEILLEAFGKLLEKGMPVHLLLAGDGPLKDWIVGWISREGIKDHCTITGRIPHSDMPSVVSLMDIAVAPRSTFYASPMKILEYMAMGKTVVAPSTENIMDIIDDGINGILFEKDNPEGLEQAIARLLDDIGSFRELGRNARLKVEKQLNWHANAQVVTNWVKENFLNP